jgi:signal transduction histidine kinase
MENALSALVIHDIKNALALLEVELEQLNHHAGVPIEGQRAYRRCIELKGRLMSFLTLYKHDQSGLKPVISEVDVVEFLEDLMGDSQSVMMGKNHQGHLISVNVEYDRIKVAALDKGIGFFDGNLVELALESALNNALRYARHRVGIWFEQEADALAFRVFDDGIGVGIADETMQRGAKSSSTGLGLALCEAVAKAHGSGTVSLDNVPGGGTLFTLTLHRAGERT